LSEEEFKKDLSHAALAKNLIRKYLVSQTFNIRLLLNHVIQFTNVFELQAAKEMLMHMCNEKEQPVMKTLLLYLGFLGKHEYSNIGYDVGIAEILKEQSR
jgi:hypothetical protein